MALHYIGIDPETGDGNCPTVWVDERTSDLVLQGWKADAATQGECLAIGAIPETEAVIRIPARMVPLRTSGIALPGNDFWLIDERVVRWNHFSGDGLDTEPEMSEDPAVAKLCASAFEAVWKRGIPHDQYTI